MERGQLRKTGGRCPAGAYTMHDPMGRQKVYTEAHESEHLLIVVNESEVHVCMHCGCLFVLEKKDEV
jgi:hypothetical protein